LSPRHAGHRHRPSFPTRRSSDSPEGGAGAGRLTIDFPIEGIRALVATHVHIDHVGRIPWLLAAGFKGPILCSEPSARLLPIVLEDRKSTRLNSSHVKISYAVFCL